jgi:DNA-binding MarR family transcriptional regulator
VRRSREGDRRQIPLELTDAGLSLAGELAEVTRPFVDDLAQELGPGLEQIVTGLETLAEAAARMRER